MILKLVLLLNVAIMACDGYHHYNSKTDYANSKWRSKYYAASKDNNNAWGNKNHNSNKNNYRVATTENPHRIRHGGYLASRFSRLDGFMNRLDRYRYGTTTTTKKPRWNSYRTNSDSVEGMWGDSYDGTDYTDEELDTLNDGGFEDEDSMDENNDDNDTDYEDDDLEDKTGDVQAEEASNANESSFTATKWEKYGTIEKVHQSRKKHLQSVNNGGDSMSSLVIEHFKKVTKAAECSTPVAKVLSIQKEYPNPGKTYMPHCTILHRCSEDTGCCHDPTKQCGPKTQTTVHLYFYIQHQETVKTQKLAFVNHTSCECIDKNRLNSTGSSMDDLNTIEPPLNLRAGGPPEHLRRCKCPAEFIPSYKYNQCNCVCMEGSVDCDRMRKGKEYISLKDRMCIKNGQCTTPACEYGSYVKDLGRCPKKQEK